MNNEQQTQQADDPSGPEWRDVEVGEILQSDDMLSDGTRWSRTDAAGTRCTWQDVYRRRIEPQQQPQPQQAPDDPSGDGWRDVGPDELLQEGDVQPLSDSERCQMLKIETLSDMVQQLIADRDEHKRKVANMEGLQERLNAALRSNDGLEHDIQRQHELLRAAKQRNAELQCLVSQAEQQEDRQKLTRQFALAIMSTEYGGNLEPDRVWSAAKSFAAAEPQMQKENEQ